MDWLSELLLVGVFVLLWATVAQLIEIKNILRKPPAQPPQAQT